MNRVRLYAALADAAATRPRAVVLTDAPTDAFDPFAMNTDLYREIETRALADQLVKECGNKPKNRKQKRARR